MTNICDNQECSYNRKAPYSWKNYGYVDVMEGDDVVRVNRHLYKSNGPKEFEFYLCDVCHSAVQMVTNSHGGK